MPSTPEATIRVQWDRLGGSALGRKLFSLLLGRMVPYTGSIAARVEELGAGHAVVSLRDRRAVRNHLRSVHAVALLNLAEVTGGLALNYALPPDARAILKALSMEYHKKARGELTATCNTSPPETNEERECELETEIRDEEGEVVATSIARWKVGPRTPPAGEESGAEPGSG
jgi:acyl-coenzyme A thioesterase PaaI-like protein